MKNYSSYQKTEQVYISGEFAFPIVLVAIASLISYALLYFFGIGIAIFFNVVISWLSYGYLYYYGKSNVEVTFDFLKGVLLFISVLLFVDYGVYVLVVYQKTGVFNVLYFQLWLSILFGIPILYYGFQYARYFFEVRKQALRYFKVSLTVHHDRELLMQIDSIQFVNTVNATMSDIKLEKAPCFYSEEELKKYDSRNKNHYLEKNYYDGRINMPFDTNFLFMSWYSIIEDKYYDIELPFPYEKLTIEQEKYPTDVSAMLRGKKAKRLNLHIYANGGIRLFDSDIVLIDIPESISSDITEQKRNKSIEHHRSSHDYYRDPKAFFSLVAKIKASGGIEERFLIQNKLILWSILVSGLKGENYLEVFDVSFKEYKKEFDVIQISKLQFLPKKLQIVYRGNYLYSWLILRINTQKLYQYIQKLTDQDETIPVIFNLVFENFSKTNLKFTINTPEKSMVFTDWEIEINKENKQSMEDHLLDKDEDEQKITLLKEGWALLGNKQYNLAQEKCNAIIAIDPRYGYAYFLESRLLWHKEGFEACYAKRDYFIAKTKHEPSALAHIYNNYGCLLDGELRYEESKSYFEKAIESYQKEGVYVCNLAEMYCKLKDPKKAMELAEKAKKLGHESETLNVLLESKGMNYFTN